MVKKTISIIKNNKMRKEFSICPYCFELHSTANCCKYNSELVYETIKTDSLITSELLTMLEKVHYFNTRHKEKGYIGTKSASELEKLSFKINKYIEGVLNK